MRWIVIPLLAAAVVVPSPSGADDGAPGWAAEQADAAQRLVQAAAADTLAYERLRVLCDTYGHRLSGSATLEAAIAWAAELLRADGLEPALEPVEVPVWVRGEGRATLLAPVQRELPVLALGMSVGTPPGGIEAEVVVVQSFAALTALGRERVQGRIVLYDVPFTTYGETAAYRGRGAVEAAKLGAVAVLLRSVTSQSLQTPHTGGMRYLEGVPQIPAAAITVEDAAWLGRLAAQGVSPRVRLELGAAHQGTATSHNVVATLPGRERPEEVVLLGCHYDSWDVGQGAQDDGVGCLMVWRAVTLMKELGLTPRRSVRVVLFTNEENGLGGARAYASAHAAELHNHVAALESDTGNGRTDGYRVELGPTLGRAERLRAQGLLWELSLALDPLGAGRFVADGSGADLIPLVAAGVPGLGVNHDTTTYWPIHHTWADTFDKIVLEDLQYNLGVIAATAWHLAEMPERLVEPPAPPRKRR